MVSPWLTSSAWKEAASHLTKRAADVVGHPLFQQTAVDGANKVLHRFIIFKTFLTVVLLISAIAVSASYCKAHDKTRKKRVMFFADMWVGEQVGVMGTLVILWLPTLLFLVALKIFAQ